MQQIILDTNYYIRLLLGDVPAQLKLVEAQLQRAQKGEVSILLPSIILFEIYFVLEKLYKLEKSDIIEKLKVIISTEYIWVDEKEVFLEALDISQRCTLSFPDCYLHALSLVKNVPLHTFDKKLEKLQ